MNSVLLGRPCFSRYEIVPISAHHLEMLVVSPTVLTMNMCFECGDSAGNTAVDIAHTIL